MKVRTTQRDAPVEEVIVEPKPELKRHLQHQIRQVVIVRLLVERKRPHVQDVLNELVRQVFAELIKCCCGFHLTDSREVKCKIRRVNALPRQTALDEI